MRRFAALFEQLDASTATQDKLAALGRYFAAAPAADAAWAVYFLAGGKPRQVVPTAVLRATACRLAAIPDWLFEECYQAVGDLAETIALVLPPAAADDDDGRAPAGTGDGLAPAGAEGGDGLAPAGAEGGDGLAFWVEQRLLPLRGLAPAEQSERLAAALGRLDTAGRFLLVKLIGGAFRVGVSRLLVQRALAAHAGLDAKLLAERMMGYADARASPSAARFEALIAPLPSAGGAPAGDEAAPHADATGDADAPRADATGAAAAAAGGASGQPYPFFLAHALAGPPAALGPVADWQLEWKFDGIRAQIVKRRAQVWIWSRGEELITERFPELVAAAQGLPEGSVLDGEILVWPDAAARPAPFQILQRRIARKTLTKKLLAEAPASFVAYDLLQAQGEDRRGQALEQRRAALEALLAGSALRLSPRLAAADWDEAAAARATARERGFEGLMLKQRGSRYGSGRTRSEGTWWKWKLDPLTVDAVLVYAQAGHGRRASVYTDYTFAVWSRPPRDAAEAAAVVHAIERREAAPARDSPALQLLPFAKAYSGLTDEEFAAVDRSIRATTIDKFGPVRSVKPTLVFEIGFEGIAASARHKSGIAVRFPRMLRIRADKPLHEADSIQALQALIAAA